MKKVAIIQSCYIPWKGYFDIINSVDEFVLLDDVQYTRRDWRNRNIIKTPQGARWLTIPVQTKGKYTQQINQITVNDVQWGSKHWDIIYSNYHKAPYFKNYSEQFYSIYHNNDELSLSKINIAFLHFINNLLQIRTKITVSTDYKSSGKKSKKLIDLCKQTGAEEYVSGPAAKAYLDQSIFNKEGINVVWADYNGYPKYTQLYPPFIHSVSIIDLLFNEGPDAKKYMKSFRKNKTL